MAHNITPGYCVVQRPGTLAYQAQELFRDTRSPAVSLFMKLNADTQWLIPGQILIVVDPNTPTPLTTHILKTLRQAKDKTNQAFIGVSSEDASFMQKHFGTIAALTSAGDKIFGTSGDAGEKYFNAIEQTLKKIEASYQNQFLTQGTLIGQQFFVERNQLLNQLKDLVNRPLLGAIARNTIKFQQYEDMKRALNLSSRSIVHEWATVGIGAIPGYSYYVGNAARAARFLKVGGYIGIGFSFVGTTNNVVNACTTGRESDCGRAAFKSYSKFGLSTILGVGGGAVGASAGGAICVGLGIITAPAAGMGGLACAVVGSVTGGMIGSSAGESVIDYFLKD